jgi:hypothetical protein
MKTHDCHTLLQRILAAGLKGIAPKEMYNAIADLGRFFRELCARTLKVKVLERLKVEIVLILCRLENIFPPTFFNVMIHLAVHLPDEAILRGPVHYGWMYPVEGRLGHLKATIRNKGRPEGSLLKSILSMSASHFAQDILVMTWKQDLTKLKGIRIIIEKLVVMSSKFSLMEPKDLENHI